MSSNIQNSRTMIQVDSAGLQNSQEDTSVGVQNNNEDDEGQWTYFFFVYQ